MLCWIFFKLFFRRQVKLERNKFKREPSWIKSIYHIQFFPGVDWIELKETIVLFGQDVHEQDEGIDQAFSSSKLKIEINERKLS